MSDDEITAEDLLKLLILAKLIEDASDTRLKAVNDDGEVSALSENGRFYCGREVGPLGFGHAPIDVCCNGKCGPNNGHQCKSCCRLQIVAGKNDSKRNRDGAPTRVSYDRVHTRAYRRYCGRKMGGKAAIPRTNPAWRDNCCDDGVCGPLNGCQCAACLQMEIDDGNLADPAQASREQAQRDRERRDREARDNAEAQLRAQRERAALEAEQRVQQEKEAHWRKEAESKRLLEQALADAERFKRVADYSVASAYCPFVMEEYSTEDVRGSDLRSWTISHVGEFLMEKLNDQVVVDAFARGKITGKMIADGLVTVDYLQQIGIAVAFKRRSILVTLKTIPGANIDM